jgi:hypothetical protein
MIEFNFLNHQYPNGIYEIKKEPSKHHVQPCLNSDPRQLPLTILTNLQPDATALVIIL